VVYLERKLVGKTRGVRRSFREKRPSASGACRMRCATRNGESECASKVSKNTETKKQSPNTGERANYTLHKQLGYPIGESA